MIAQISTIRIEVMTRTDTTMRSLATTRIRTDDRNDMEKIDGTHTT
jgi:hypothetical protein